MLFVMTLVFVTAIVLSFKLKTYEEAKELSYLSKFMQAFMACQRTLFTYAIFIVGISTGKIILMD